MLAAAERWGGGEDERPYLAARVLGRARARRTRRTTCSRTSGRGRGGCASWRGDGVLGAGAARPGLRPAARGAPCAAGRRRRRDRPAGDPARTRCWRGGRGPAPARSCSAFATAPAPRAPRCCAGRSVATDDGSVGHAGLRHRSARRRARARRAHAVVYACGPAPMLEAVRALCAARETPAQLALEAGWRAASAPATGASCPRRDGGYLRVCVDGPVLDAGRAATRGSTRTPGRTVDERRVLRPDAGAPGDQRLGHVRRDRRRPRVRRARWCRSSRSRPTSPRRSRCARARATRRRACGRRRRA